MACRAGTETPFHLGDTLDWRWANVNATFTYGRGRKGPERRRVLPAGAFRLVNRWGLAEMNGQLLEWCGDQWHVEPNAPGWPADGTAWEGEDPKLADVPQEREMWLMRGGSWYDDTSNCRSACRDNDYPNQRNSYGGFRPCCSLSPGPS